MELVLNILWLLLAVASFALVWRGGDHRNATSWHSLRRILCLACLLIIIFPVISLTDDLHATPVVMEDSNPLKRISKSSAAFRGASNCAGSSLFFTAVQARILPAQMLRSLGMTAGEAGLFLFSASLRPSNPRAPPSPVLA